MSEIKKLSEPMTQQQYLAAHGSKCPSCGSTQIESCGDDFEYSTFSQYIMCHHCGDEWTDVYQLTGYQR